MLPHLSFPPARGRMALAAAALALSLALPAPVIAAKPVACVSGGRVLKVGFYPFFKPLSYSADANPKSAGFNEHRGYEADLLSALEAMKGAGLSFSRRPVARWKNIWLRAAGAEYDIMSGGISIRGSRTRDAAGRRTILFTSGHAVDRQSLLVRARDAGRLASHKALGGARVGVLRGATGEARLLRLTGLADAAGILAAGVRVRTPRGEVVADGSANYVITSGGASPSLAGRLSLAPPSGAMPRVMYLGSETGEAELLAALREDRVDAVARAEISNRDAAHASGGAFSVTALDLEAEERAGFALSAKDADLAACLDEKINWLTDNRRIGYKEWRADSSVFMRRARLWQGGK